jgi:uncharacterized protein (TIGR03000 family)
MLKCIPFSAKVAALAAAILLGTAATSEAQHHGGGSHGGGWHGGGGHHGGVNWGVSIGTPYFGAYYGSPYWGGYGRGYYGGYGYYPSYGYAYEPYYYGYGYSPYYYTASPYYNYYDSPVGYVQPGTSYQSFYPPDYTTQQNNSANILVIVPPNAEIWFDGKKTSQTGQERMFVTPELTPGKSFSYEVRATWMDSKGNAVTQTRTVMVEAGKRSTVNFLEPERQATRDR